tara:strand:- start:9239 stop:9523 length:285 start_codon:yes stop_codon:yes gene_type:complete
MNVANAMVLARWAARTLAHAIMMGLQVATMEVALFLTVVVFVVETASVDAPTVSPAIMRKTLGATMVLVYTTTPLAFAMAIVKQISTRTACATM